MRLERPDEADLVNNQFGWIPRAIMKDPGILPACAEFLESRGRCTDAAMLRFAVPQGIPMVWCPPGSFTMGGVTDAYENSRWIDSVHVTLTRGFWISKYPVTAQCWNIITAPQYDSVETACDMLSRLICGSTSVVPRTGVLWHDALAFTRRLTTRAHAKAQLPANWGYTLPTEAQWEYALRAGSVTKFHFGDDIGELNDYAWYEAAGGWTMQQINNKKPNGWGIHDMIGFISEWCLDAWSNTLPGGVDPVVDSKDLTKVVRGGAAACWADRCLSAWRAPLQADVKDWSVGFRMVLASVDYS